MLKKQHYIILVLVVALVVALLNLPSPAAGKLKLAISGLFVPLFGLAASTHALAGKAGDTLVSKGELIGEIEGLRQTNQWLTLQLQQATEVRRENARLSLDLKISPQRAWKARLARLISREPTTWWRSAWIDLGSRDGVRTNSGVLTAAGLVGKVELVGETRSQIILLGDPNLRVAVLAGTGTNSEGGVLMAGSSSPRENNMVDLDYLSGTSAVRPGDRVITWGIGQMFPTGIPVGQVVDVQQKRYGLTTEARVKLFADLNALEEVWVIVP